MVSETGRAPAVDFEETLERAVVDCTRVLARLGIPAQDRPDLVQDAMLLFLQRRDEVDRPERWLPAVARTLGLRYWRARRWAMARLVDSTILELIRDARACVAERTALRRDLTTALKGLRDRCRRLLILRYAIEYEAAEVAERIGYAASGLNTLTRRCVAQLGQQLIAAGLAPDGKKRRP